MGGGYRQKTRENMKNALEYALPRRASDDGASRESEGPRERDHDLAQ